MDMSSVERLSDLPKEWVIGEKKSSFGNTEQWIGNRLKLYVDDHRTGVSALSLRNQGTTAGPQSHRMRLPNPKLKVCMFLVDAPTIVFKSGPTTRSWNSRRHLVSLVRLKFVSSYFGPTLQ